MTRDEALRRAESVLYGAPRMELPKDSGQTRKVADEIQSAYNEGRDAQARETIKIIRETEPEWGNDQYTPADYVRDQIRDAVRRARPSAFSDPTVRELL